VKALAERGARAHSAIQSNLIAALATALRGKPCRAHGGELNVRTATSVRYPGALSSAVAPTPNRPSPPIRS
jgi:hypothetical protein